jgi:TRAP-type C4-dicarboxylate transport system permease small subunit
MDMHPYNSRFFAAAISRYFYKPVDKVVSNLERFLLLLCSLAILLAMVITAIDVVLRYGFSEQLGWTFDFVMLYLLPAAYYLAFSYALKNGAHLSVDFFVDKLPALLTKMVYPVILVIGAALFFYIAYLMAEQAYASFKGGETLFGSISWLTWPTGAIMSASFFVFSVRLVLNACREAFLKG